MICRFFNGVEVGIEISSAHQNKRGEVVFPLEGLNGTPPPVKMATAEELGLFTLPRLGGVAVVSAAKKECGRQIKVPLVKGRELRWVPTHQLNLGQHISVARKAARV